MSKLVLAIVFSLLAILPAAAFDTPQALLKALYAPYAKGDSFDWGNWDETVFRSAALNALFEKDAAESGGMGRLDFDPYIDGQDYQISKLKIGEPAVTGETAQVVVHFENFGTPDTLTYSLVKEADGWKVDDVSNSNPDFAYSLKAIMSGPLDD